jgi:hypothetical protein
MPLLAPVMRTTLPSWVIEAMNAFLADEILAFGLPAHGGEALPQSSAICA